MNINLFVYIPFFLTACSDLSNQYLLKFLPLLIFMALLLASNSDGLDNKCRL